MDTKQLALPEQREAITKIGEEMQKAEEAIDSEREVILSRVWHALNEILSNCGLGNEEICGILGFDFEIDRRRRGTIIKLADVFDQKFPDFDRRLIPESSADLSLEYEEVDETLLPPDEQDVISGEGEFIQPGVVPREKYIKETLSQLGVNIALLPQGKVGKNTPNMMRKLSYKLIPVPEIDKMILFCEEEGNRTFIRHGMIDPEEFYSKRKSELRVDENVENLIWTNDSEVWKRKLAESLTREEYENPAKGQKPKVATVVKEKEIDGCRSLRPEDISEEGLITIETEVDGSIQRKRAVVPEKYFRFRGSKHPPGKVIEMVAQAGLTSVPNIKFVARKREVEIFWEEDVDRVFPRKLGDDKTYEYEGRKAILLGAYTKKCREAGKSIDSEQVLQIMEHNGFTSVPLTFQSGRKRVQLFFEDELEKSTPERLETWEILLRGDIYTSYTVFAKLNRHAPTEVKRWIDEAGGLTSHPVLGRGIDYYLRYEIEDIRTNLPGHLIWDNGYSEIDGRLAVSIQAKTRTDVRVIKRLIEEREIRPIEGATFRRVGSGLVPEAMYWDDELEKVIPLKLDKETGTVEIDGEIYVGLSRYGTVNRCEARMTTSVKESSLIPYKGEVVVFSGNSRIELYKKDEVDKLMKFI
jgi:hypothetical protein